MSTVEKTIIDLEATANKLQHIPSERRRAIIKNLVRNQTNNNPVNQDLWLRYHSALMGDFLLSCVEDVRYNTHR
jgi:cellulose biosynthesis protein BcsQ